LQVGLTHISGFPPLLGQSLWWIWKWLSLPDHILTTFAPASTVTRPIEPTRLFPENLIGTYLSRSFVTAEHDAELTFNPKVESSILSGPTEGDPLIAAVEILPIDGQQNSPCTATGLPQTP